MGFYERNTGTNLALGLLLICALLFRNSLLLIMFAFLLLVVLGARLWGKYALKRVEYSRHLERDRCFVGEELELRVELTNRKVLPVTYLAVDDQVPMELEIASRRLAFMRTGTGTLRFLFGLTWYQKVIRHYRIRPNRRGYYRLGPAMMQGGDPFGFAEDKQTLEQVDGLVVYPRVVPLDALGIPSRRPFGDLRSRDRLFQDPLRFAGVRDYQAGDPLNRIHWKASAASGHLQTRLLDPSSQLGVAVFLNTWGWELFWQGVETSVLEAACVTAASVANWACDEGLPVGLYANGLIQGWGMTLRLPPARGPQVLPQVLEGLARLQMPVSTSVADLLNEEAQALQYGTSVIVITRQVTEETADAMLRIQRSGRPVTLIVVGQCEVPTDLPGIQIYQVAGEEALHATLFA